jgi:hypothetical protein
MYHPSNSPQIFVTQQFTIEARAQVLEIRDALGHTTVRMSERYAKPNERALDRMREALNAWQQRTGATQLHRNQGSNYRWKQWVKSMLSSFWNWSGRRGSNPRP